MGLYNFNDSVIIALHMIFMIRQSLLERFPPSDSISTIIRASVTADLPEQLVRQIEWAYLTFEALSRRDFDHRCPICKDDPPIIIYDGNQQLCIDVPVETLAGTRAGSSKVREAAATAPARGSGASGGVLEDPGVVYHTAFWRRVHREVLKACVMPVSLVTRDFLPAMREWAPWTMPSSAGHNAMNTEESKKSIADEDDITELAGMHPAVLLDFIDRMSNRLTITEITVIASERGYPKCPENKTKFAMLEDLAKRLLADAERMAAGKEWMHLKTFAKLRGATGGVFFGVCAHGVVYQFKIMVQGGEPPGCRRPAAEHAPHPDLRHLRLRRWPRAAHAHPQPSHLR